MRIRFLNKGLVLNRIKGPAIIWYDGSAWYYTNGDCTQW